MSNLKASGKVLPSARGYVTTSGKFAKFETFKAVDSRGQPQKNSNQIFRTNILYLPDIRNIYIYIYMRCVYIYMSYVYPALTLVT